jgi:hypothetical protein
LVGNWMPMRPRCSITRAPNLDQTFAGGRALSLCERVCLWLASRTASISHIAVVWNASRI